MSGATANTRYLLQCGVLRDGWTRRRSKRVQRYSRVTVTLCLLMIGMVMSAISADSPPRFDLGSLDGKNGFVIHVASSGRSSSQLNAVVSAAGDINGDDIADIVVGAPGALVNGRTWVGLSYVIFGTEEGFPRTVDATALNGSDGFVFYGANAGDAAGYSVSGAGDYNGDGIDDVIIGAPSAAPDRRLDAGQIYIVFGRPVQSMSTTPFPSAPSQLNGQNGFVVNGANAGDRAGQSVAAAGDINNDGIDDIIIGARPGVGRLGHVQACVVYGRRTPPPTPMLDLRVLHKKDGFCANGSKVDSPVTPSTSVSGLGDINGDKIDDVIIGSGDASAGDRSAAGQSYVVFGFQGDSHPFPLELGQLNGVNGFIINGIAAGNLSGESVAGAGDINRDGINDILIAAFNARQSYLVFGKPNGESFPSPFELSSLTGSNGFRMQAPVHARIASVAGIGDINGDGFEDVISGAPEVGPDSRNFDGQSYVVFGNGKSAADTDGDDVPDAPFPAVLELVNLDGENGFVIDGLDLGLQAGKHVSGIGDVNADGTNDFAIGTFVGDAGVRAGQAYVVFGRAPYVLRD